MFFIGILSSSIPYILLLGFVLTCTLTANGDVLEQNETDSEKKVILIQTTSNETLEFASCYHFTGTKQQDKQTQSKALGRLTAPTVKFGTPKPTSIRNPHRQPFYLKPDVSRIFGLSPPLANA